MKIFGTRESVRNIFKIIFCSLLLLMILETVVFSSIIAAPDEIVLPSSINLYDFWNFLSQGNIAEAENLLNVLSKKDSKSLDLKVALGYLSFEKGNWESAIKTFKKIVKKGELENPSLMRYENRRAVSLAFIGYAQILIHDLRYKEAKAVLLRTVELYNNPVAYSLLGQLARKSDKDLALSGKIHREIYERYPGKFEGNQIQLAIVYIYENKIKEAEALISDVKNPDNFSFDLAVFYSVAGESEKSFIFMEKELKKYREYPLQIKKIKERLFRDPDFKNLISSPYFKKL